LEHDTLSDSRSRFADAIALGSSPDRRCDGVGLVVVAGACANDGGGDGADAATTVAPETTVAPDTTTAGDTTLPPAPDEEPFRIGLAGPLSGPQSQVGIGMLRGAELAAAQLNRGDGIDGRPVVIVPIDDMADPDTGIAAAQAAIAAGLDAVVGPYNSGVGIEVLPLYLDADLTPLRLTSSDSTAGLGVTLQPMTSQIAPSATAALSQWLDVSSVGIVVDDTTAYTTGAAEQMRTLLAAADIEIVSDQAIAPGASSYREVLVEALSAGAEALYLIAYYPEAGQMAIELADLRAGADAGESAAITQAAQAVVCVADYGAFDDGFIDTAGVDAASGCSVVGVPSPEDFSDGAELTEAFRAEFGEEPNVWSPHAYDSVFVIADAVARVAASDGIGPSDDGFAAAFAAALADTDLAGWTGSIRFEAVTGNRLPNQVAVLTVTSDGRFALDEAWATAVEFDF
jgi:branched-chain amino acid transport system substrate-binding protein